MVFPIQFLDDITEGILVINYCGKIIYSNKFAAHLFAIDLEKTCNINDIWENKMNDFKCHWLNARELEGSNQPITQEYTHMLQGKERTFLHRFYSLNEPDGSRKTIIISTDISEFNKTKQIAENPKLADDQFMTNMTHELKTPMIGILGYLDLLEQGPLSPDQAEKVNVIRQCGEQLLDLINDILDVSKIEMGLIELRPSAVNLQDLIKKTVSIIANSIRKKNLMLEVDIDPRLPLEAMLDEQKFRQLLLNILHNAVKFTYKGRIKVNAILEQNHPGDSWLQVSVSDTGIGIPPSKLELIFDCFAQADTSNSRKFGGSGLGLYISYRLITLMGGEIWVNSEEGTGSTFSFRVPLINVDNLPDKKENSQTSLRLGAPELTLDFVPVSVLIVEDNLLNQKLLVQTLQNYGFEVTVASNGLECLNILQHLNFDIILMDMQMPVMDGYEATRIIRENQRWDHVPIIAITAHAMNGDRDKCLASGCSSYLAKPFRPQELIQEIRSNINGRVIRKCSLKNDPQQLFSELLPEFIESVGEILVELEEAVQLRDSQKILSASHAIKGTAGLYGFTQLSNLAASLEDSAREHNHKKNSILLSQMRSLFQQVHQQVEHNASG